MLLSDSQGAAVRAACGLAGDAEQEPACAAPRGYSSALPRRDGICPSYSTRLNVPATQARAGEKRQVSEITHLFPRHTTRAEGFYLPGSGYLSLRGATRSCGLGTIVPGTITAGLMSMKERSQSFLHTPSCLSRAVSQCIHSLRLCVVKYGLRCLGSSGTILNLATVCTD